MIKSLFGLALRQASGMVSSLLKLSGVDWSTPDYSTLCRRQQRLQVCIAYRPNPKGLHLLVDSTGVKMLGEGGWKTKKHGAEYRRQWRKVHLGIDAKTLEIWAIEVTSNREGDAEVLPVLLEQIPAEERIEAVSGDGAYDTKNCHAAFGSSWVYATNPQQSKEFTTLLIF
jgi:IS5 family transposase